VTALTRTGPFTRGDIRLIGATVLATIGAGVTHYVSVGSVLPFIVSAIALALLATMVGRSVEALGDRLGSGATGILQSALGNLPELLILSFALHRGLLTVVHTALIGSILSNLLLVLGAAFIAGGLRHGTQRFGTGQARMLSVMMMLSAAALLVPSLTWQLHTPAAAHEGALSVVLSIVLLLAFALSLPFSLRNKEAVQAEAPAHEQHEARWPLLLAVVVLAVTGVLAAGVSDWFVAALEPAVKTLHISDGFAGLVIVAIAGNAVENVVGVQLALKNRADYALSVILQSPLQIALVVAPILVLLSYGIAAAPLTLVFPPLLVAALAIGSIVTVVVVVDGESNWLEGCVLVGLYGILATSFWWG
jgi:Ca2+:H+ antiporter